jgi:tetratricopeptide (TPR) repeat protein
VYEELARYDDAIREFEQSRELMDLPMVVANLAHAHAVAGNRAIAEQLLQELAETATQRFVSPFFVAAVYAGLKEPDRAFDWLAKATESRDGWIPYLHCDPRFDVLRSDERFSSLVARIGVVR